MESNTEWYRLQSVKLNPHHPPPLHAIATTHRKTTGLNLTFILFEFFFLSFRFFRIPSNVATVMISILFWRTMIADIGASYRIVNSNGNSKSNDGAVFYSHHTDKLWLAIVLHCIVLCFSWLWSSGKIEMNAKNTPYCN